jgi:acetyl esterase/lipase
MRRSYGPDAAQVGDLHPGRPPALVVIHGGFWRPLRSLEMTAPLAQGLARRGWSIWNVEYRRHAGWQATLDDCAAAIDHLAVIGLGTAILLGHSAGGQLAVWAAGRPRSAVRVAGVVAVAGVLDLERAARAGIGDGAVVEFLGATPDDAPDRYRTADPMRRLPTGVPVRCVHSRADEHVPFEQSARYVEAARRAGDDAELIEVEGAHADGIDLRTRAGVRVAAVVEALAARA